MAANSTSQASMPATGFSGDASTPDNRDEQGEITFTAESGDQRLPAVLGLRDLSVFMILTVLFVNNNNGVQFAGPAAFFYWTLGLLTFLVPCAFFTRWLALRFPGEGGPYLWAKRVLGARWCFFFAFCAWLPGVLAVVSVVEACIVFVQYLAPTWFTAPAQQCLATMLVLIVATAINCFPLTWVKRLLLALTALYLAVFALIGATGIWWLESGHQATLALNIPAAWGPAMSNSGLYGLIVLALLGANIPIIMGNEIHGGKAGFKRASRYVWWGTGISFTAYILGTFGIMAIVPPGQSGAMISNVQAINITLGSTAASIVSVVLALSQIALVAVYILLFSRLLVVLAADRRLPGRLAKLNRRGVPINSIIAQATVVAIVTILSFVAIPGIFEYIIPPAELAFEIYNLLQAATTVVWVFSVIQMFLLVPWLVLRHRRRMRTSIRQGLLLLSMVAIGTIASCTGIWATISQSWLPTLIPDQRWAILVIIITAVALALGWIVGELPRVNAMLNEQRRLNDREIALRARLQEAYNEQQILVQQQQLLVSELDRLYREQASAAITDPITGLPNHRAVMSRINEEVSRCQRSQDSFAILFVDLDHFKRVNDTWGHRAGDAILREVGTRLRNTLRLEDLAGRYGGEEFAIILTGADLLAANQVAERLLASISAKPCLWESEDTPVPVPIAITASIGIAVYGLHGTTREALIESADQGMYRAKHTGRNRVCVADVETDRPAIARTELVPYDRHTTEIVGVKALTAAAAAHDRRTNAHAHRIVQLAEATARKLQRPDEELHLIRLGALLHDIGKIGIPDAILHKPGPLTEEEWSVMRSHPEIGRQILEQVGGIFDYLATIVAAHHERWDGKGYPLGLAGEQIPLSARILAVVDAYDAMVSTRPYRKAMPVSEARKELLACAGKQFDAAVVEAFLSVLSEQDENCVLGEIAQQPDLDGLPQRA
ncbi:MAG TPA: amino acid permease [Ktedonobacteraceae bacterium]|nr:amino acid permease [Ktedonobacteraceae bacterium]